MKTYKELIKFASTDAMRLNLLGVIAEKDHLCASDGHRAIMVRRKCFEYENAFPYNGKNTGDLVAYRMDKNGPYYSPSHSAPSITQLLFDEESAEHRGEIAISEVFNHFKPSANRRPGKMGLSFGPGDSWHFSFPATANAVAWFNPYLFRDLGGKTYQFALKNNCLQLTDEDDAKYLIIGMRNARGEK
jgi:hypothetical protein